MARAYLALISLVAVALPLLYPSCEAQRIKVLLTGQIDNAIEPLQMWFSSEPLVDYLPVPSRDLAGNLGGDEAMKRFIRLYFPRTLEEVKGFDFILLNSPVVYLFTSEQLAWMYEAIVAGTGGLNTASVMSQDAGIHGAWAASVLQTAFPNDAPAVVAKYAGATSSIGPFRIRVNRDFPEPIFTPFIPLGVETFNGYDSRIIIAREGASTLAWQVGNLPALTDVPYIAIWDYQNGRTITTGDAFGHTFWSSYRGGRATDNIYALDILMNMIFYCTRRNLPGDVLAFHNMRTSFLEFRTRMGMLTALMEFIDRFGANPDAIQSKAAELEQLAGAARERYLAQDFDTCAALMESAIAGFVKADAEALELRRRALLWVYVIEWMVTTSVLMISSTILWALMVRRRLYRAVALTRAR